MSSNSPIEKTVSAMDPQTILPPGNTVDTATATRAAAPTSENTPATSDGDATALAVGTVDGIGRLMTVTWNAPYALAVMSSAGRRSEQAVDRQGGVSLRIEAGTCPGGRACPHFAELGGWRVSSSSTRDSDATLSSRGVAPVTPSR